MVVAGAHIPYFSFNKIFCASVRHQLLIEPNATISIGACQHISTFQYADNVRGGQIDGVHATECRYIEHDLMRTQKTEK